MALSLAGATLGAGLISGASSAFGAMSSAKASNKAVSTQIKWERERAQNAHQWEVEDLKKAGLNPILAAGGSGAVTGGISAPVPDTSGYSQAGQTAISSALDAYRIHLDAKKNTADVNVADATAENIKQDSLLKQEQTLNELEKRHLISKQTATEISKQTLNYATAEKAHQELTAIKQKLEVEIEEIRNKIQLAKANKDYQEVKTLQEQYNKQMQQLTYIIEQTTKVTNALSQGVSSAAKMVDAIIPL